MITSQIVVRRKYQGWESWQLLVKEWRMFGIKVWSRVIDKEEIPQHVYLQYLAFGDWHGWRSKFADWIDAEKQGNGMDERARISTSTNSTTDL